MHWYPTTTIGKTSWWMGVTGFVLLYVQYWVAMLFKTSVFLPGFLVIVLILCAGIGSVLALTKYRDRAILLVLSTAIGAFGLLMIIGELVFPH